MAPHAIARLVHARVNWLRPALCPARRPPCWLLPAGCGGRSGPAATALCAFEAAHDLHELLELAEGR